MWNDGFSSALYYIVNSDGEIYLQDLLLSYDGVELILLDKISIKHVSHQNINGNLFPAYYEVKAESKDIQMEYSAKVVNRKVIKTWGYPEYLLKDWVPGLPLLHAEGQIIEGDGRKIRIKGKGIFEFILNK